MPKGSPDKWTENEAWDEIKRITETMARVVRLETDIPRVGIVALMLAAGQCAWSIDMSREDFDQIIHVMRAIIYRKLDQNDLDKQKNSK